MTDFDAVTALLQKYFDGLYHSDADLLGTIFHPRAIYASADEQPLLYKTMDEYLPIVAARPAPASRNEARTDKIESIEFAGGNTALARVRCSIGARHFIDFLSLTRIDGKWLIMAKVFHFEEREG